MRQKILFVGDMHCKQRAVLPFVDKAVRMFSVDVVVFMGDYVDDWYESTMEALDFHVNWYQRRKHEVNVVNLCGNHDYCYLFPTNTVASGHDYENELKIRLLLQDLNIQASWANSEVLATHAGVTKDWLLKYGYAGPFNASDVSFYVNKLYLQGAQAVNSVGSSRGGSQVAGPFWCDFNKDVPDAKLHDLEDYPFFDQVVAHTPASSITVKTLSNQKNVVWDVDTMSTTSFYVPLGDGSMLLLDESVIGVRNPCKVVRRSDVGLESWSDVTSGARLAMQDKIRKEIDKLMEL